MKELLDGIRAAVHAAAAGGDLPTSPATGSPRDAGGPAAERAAQRQPSPSRRRRAPQRALAPVDARARALMRGSPFMSTVVAARKEERRRIKWKLAHGVPGVALGDEGAPARRTRRRGDSLADTASEASLERDPRFAAPRSTIDDP